MDRDGGARETSAKFLVEGGTKPNLKKIQRNTVERSLMLVGRRLAGHWATDKARKGFAHLAMDKKRSPLEQLRLTLGFGDRGRIDSRCRSEKNG